MVQTSLQMMGYDRQKISHQEKDYKALFVMLGTRILARGDVFYWG